MTLLALATRVEALDGPDREVGREVLLALGWTKTCVGYFCGEMFHWRSSDRKRGFNDDHFDRYDPTASLDAVVALITEKLPGCGFVVSKNAGGNRRNPCIACLEQDDDRWTYEGWPQCLGATPALALLAAALRAIASQENRK